MGFGGPLLLPLSLLLEILLSALYAPILMLAQSRVVWLVLRGRDGGWQPQSRDDGALSLMTALRAHWTHTLVGVVLSSIAWLLSEQLFLWLLPITAGLLLSVPLSWISGGVRRGRLFDLLGLLRAPEERRPCEVLAKLEEELAGCSPDVDASRGVKRLAEDTALREWHLAQLTPRPVVRPPGQADVARITAHWKTRHATSLDELHDWLSDAEERALLADREELLDALRLP